MPRTNCQHCRKLFSVRAGAVGAKVICPYCLTATSSTQPAHASWFLAKGQQKLGPYAWSELTALASRGDIGTDDLLWQEGQAQWSLAGTLLHVDVPSIRDEGAPEEPRVGEDGTDLGPIQARLKELSNRLDHAPERAARPTWQAAKWLSTCATTLVAVCALAFWLKHGLDSRDRLVLPPFERHAEEQEPASNERDAHPDVLTIAAWSGEFIDELNRCRKTTGLGEVVLCPKLSETCTAHAKYLARNVTPGKATPTNVNRQDLTLPESSAPGAKTAAIALVCHGEPKAALDRWMGRLFARVQLLDENLTHIGVGFEKNADGAWVCVADPVHGLSEDALSNRAVLYPAPNQKDVPCVGFDSLDEAKGAVGYPISATYPPKTMLRNVQATLTDDDGKTVELRISSPDLPLNEKLQRTTIGLHSITQLDANRTYTVVLVALVNGAEWRQSWQFTTGQRGE